MLRTEYQNNGMSLIELMITLMIAAILTSLALPGFRNFLDNVKVTTAASQFRSAISLARTEAMRRGVRVDLIPSKGRDWSQGWMVVLDTNNNQQADTGEVILYYGGKMPDQLFIIAGLRDAKPYLSFDPSGRPRSIASSAVPQIGSFLFSVGSMKRKIIIGFLGRVRSCDPDKDQATC
jgi:type IV fimbrial biogenesis protein FimT